MAHGRVIGIDARNLGLVLQVHWVSIMLGFLASSLFASGIRFSSEGHEHNTIHQFLFLEECGMAG